jgi:serine/threonine protein kinase
MGSCSFSKENPEPVQSLSKAHFQLQYGIGKGGFGKVWKVELKKNKETFAMKEMSKARILAKKSVNSVMNERKLLSYLKHPFIVNMQYAFQDRENLYLVMDLMPGGDFRYHLSRRKNFNEEETKFFICCILLGLEFLHTSGVIHRDIKPENLVFDSKGYLNITDFGIARLWVPENAKDTSGTPGYMAPEVMCRQNHGVAVDYFAVGVIVHEIMFGTRPYLGRSRKDIRDQILAKHIQIKRDEIPSGWSTEAADFINHLLQRKPVNRLGLNGPEEVKNHPWVKDTNWQAMKNKSLVSPFIPNQDADNFDDRLQMDNDPWKDADSEAIKQNTLLLENHSTQDLFREYSYDISQSNANTETTNKNKSA